LPLLSGAYGAAKPLDLRDAKAALLPLRGNLAHATLDAGTKTKLEDLALVCSNCHRMIHATRNWLTVAELRKQLRASGA
jgi:hypothetical protein